MDRLRRLELIKKTLPEGSVEINLPPSKSIANRQLIIQSLSDSMGASAEKNEPHDIKILRDALKAGRGEVWMGDAGTASRFGIARLVLKDSEFIVRGSTRLSERPLGPLVDALNTLGANIQYLEKTGFLPVRIGRAIPRGGTVSLDASQSSQFITALMLIAPSLKGGLRILLKDEMVSRPYIQMTARLMETFGVKATMSNDEILIREGGYREGEEPLETDWSAASYFYSAVALGGLNSVFLKGLRRESLQGDKQIALIFENLGVATDFLEGGVSISRKEGIHPLAELDFLDIPDLAQTVVVAYAGLGVEGYFTGLKTLRGKETDRIAALAQELGKLGFEVEEGKDTLQLNSKKQLEENVSIDTYGDHRMAMSFAPLVFQLPRLEIQNPSVVAKSFPGFWEEFAKLGVEIKT